MQQPRKVGQDVIMRKPLNKKRVVHNDHVISREVFQHQEPKHTPRPRSDFYDLDRPHVPILAQEKKTPAKGGILWYFAGGLLLLFIISLASLLSRATVSLVLEQKQLPLTQLMVPLYGEPALNQAGYKTVTATDRQTIRVPSTNQQQVTTPATGTIKIVNPTQNPITIPVGTSITSTDGKKFIIKSRIVVPKGTPEIPGTQDVLITAGEPGESYNGVRDDFTITNFPSLRARSLTETTGGFSGKKSTIDESELTIAKTALIARLTSVRPEIYLGNQIPDGFILPTTLVNVSDPVFSVVSHEQDVEVIAERTVTGVLLEKENLTQYLEQVIIPESDRAFTRITDISQVDYLNTLGNPDQVRITLNGSVTTQTFIDADAIKVAIAQKKRKEAVIITGGIPGVVDSSIQMRPFWLFKIPLKANHIDIKTRYTDL